MEPLRPHLKRTLAALSIALVLASCAGDDAVYEVPPGAPGAAAPDDLSLPAPRPAVPAFVIRSAGFSPDVIREVERVPGVAVAATAAISRAEITGPNEKHELHVAEVDPAVFRSIAPAPTRDAGFVWTSLLSGDAVVTPEAADALGLGRSAEIHIESLGAVRVGAFADNGAPNIADVLIADSGDAAARRPGLARVAIVGLQTGTSLDVTEGRLRAIEGLRTKRLTAPGLDIVTEHMQVAVEGSAVPSIAGLHPVMSAAVDRLVVASGGRVWIVSGYRDSARQYELWVQALRKYGNAERADDWVAPPGHSMHERGLAVDLGGDLALAARLVEELKLPLWRPMSWEPWHFELAGSRG